MKPIPLLLPALLLLGACAGPRQITPGETVLRVALDPEGSRIESIPLERYVLGVLGEEVPADWPIEALKAQAVASRTYALYRKAHPRSASYDVASDTSDQVFGLRRRYPAGQTTAVEETAGETLRYEGEILPAFFHSCCGGITERADRVWEVHEPQDSPILSHLHDPFCESCPRYHWTYEISREDLGDLLNGAGLNVDDDWSLEVAERDDSGRVTKLIAFKSGGSGGSEGIQSIPGPTFRRIVGNLNLRSTLFDLTTDGDRLVFQGKGAGHGVGLCQWGAKGMADQGYSYREILEFFYPGAVLEGARVPETMEGPPDPD